jgi:2'-5' RNA ligase
MAFALLQAQEQRGLRRGAVGLELGEPSVTCVVRLPAALALPVRQVVRTLPGLERHYVYPASDLHLTVLNVAEGAVLDAVAEVLHQTAPFAVRLRGLQQSAHSVYVRAFDDSGQLRALRRRLMEVTGLRPSWPRRRLGFVTVVRYLDADIAQLGPAVRELHSRPFGMLEVTAVELVRTNKVLSADGTSLLTRTVLAGRR